MKRLTLLALTALMIAAAFVAIAQPTLESGKPGLPTVDELAKMDPAERRATLKTLDPAERRGLWIQAKRASFDTPPTPDKYSDMEGFEVNAGGWKNNAREPHKAVVGTIQYDSGFPTIGFGGGALVGNRFNTHTGIPVCNPFTVSTIEALVVPGPANTTSSAGFVILGPQTAPGGAAFALFSTFTVATGVVDSLAFSGLGVTGTGSEFFVLFGDFASVYVPVFGSESTLAQGHHGVVGYTGGMLPDIVSTFDFGGALNSFITASGVIVPVELMAFEVD